MRTYPIDVLDESLKEEKACYANKPSKEIESNIKELELAIYNLKQIEWKKVDRPKSSY